MLNGFGYFFGWLPVLIVIAANSLGGPWTHAPGAFMLVASVADWFWRSRAPSRAFARLPETVIIGQVLLQTAAVASLLVGVKTGRLAGPFLAQAVFATGMCSGIGLTAAHELTHRRERFLFAGGLWIFLMNLVGHYPVEHLQGHHRNVAMSEDAETARRGESFYHFFPRHWFRQLRLALWLEAERLRGAGKSPHGPANFVIRALLFEAALCGAVGALLGLVPLGVLLAHAFVSRVFHSAGSYMQHYGLTRAAGEKIDEHHSWQSNGLVSRAFLVENFRHADHHCRITRPYEQLEHCQHAPELPAGAVGMFPVVLFPRVWFALTRRRLERFQRASGEAVAA